jgi:hypothetical protein
MANRIVKHINREPGEDVQLTGAGMTNHDERFYGALAEHFLGFRDGAEFVYYAFVFNMYKNDTKKAIYALAEDNLILNTFDAYTAKVSELQRAGRYEDTRHFIFCGDSHAMSFEYLGLNALLGNSLSLFCRIQGTSAYGLANRNSQTGSLVEMEGLLAEPHGDPLLVLNMGEVDCRMTLWTLEQSRGLPVAQGLETALVNYRHFIVWLQERGYRRLALTAVHVPVWQDTEIWTKNAASRSDTLTLTRDFNDGLRRIADELDCFFIDINPHIANPETGALKGQFGVIRGEHHLNPETVAPFFLDALADAELFHQSR